EDLPFYRVEFVCGKVVLTLNTAHGFFKKIWEPLSHLSRTAEDATGEEADGQAEASVAGTCSEVLEGLQLLLHSLARAQSQMGVMEGEMIQRVFKKLRSEWSENLETQLGAKSSGRARRASKIFLARASGFQATAECIEKCRIPKVVRADGASPLRATDRTQRSDRRRDLADHPTPGSSTRADHNESA